MGERSAPTLPLFRSLLLFATGVEAALMRLCLCLRGDAVFVLELAPAGEAFGGQVAGLDGGLHGTSRFMCMGAIAEFAIVDQGGDFGKDGINAIGRMQLQGAHAGGVNDPAALDHGAQGAKAGGVAATTVSLTNSTSFQRIAGQRVGQGGLADTGRADEGHGLPRAAPWGEIVGNMGITGVEGDDIQPALQGEGLLAEAFGVIGAIGLGQDDHGCAARPCGKGEIAFEPGDVEIGVAGGGDEQGIDVGGDQLGGGPGAITRGGDAVQDGGAVEKVLDGFGVVDQHPVADGIGGTILMGGDDIHGAIRANGEHAGAMHLGDAQGGEVCVIPLELEGVRPTEISEGQHEGATWDTRLLPAPMGKGERLATTQAGLVAAASFRT